MAKTTQDGQNSSFSDSSASQKTGKVEKPNKVETKHLWTAIKEIVKKHYDDLKDEDLRNGFYIVRGYLETDYLLKKKITQQAYDWFALDDKAYNYYTQDIWTSLEQQEGYVRPEAHPIGFVYWKGLKYVTDDLIMGFKQVRGYIYLEKDGVAKSIMKLSYYGWGIVTAQGQPTRKIRELLKATGKPVLIVRDFDRGGKTISNSVINKTRRTKHLDINVSQGNDLVINEEQAKYLVEVHNVPVQSIPSKDKDFWNKNYRIELSALSSIKTETREPAILEFLISEMVRLKIPISLEPISKEELYMAYFKSNFKRIVGNIIDECRGCDEINGDSCLLELEVFDRKDISELLENKEFKETIKRLLKKYETKCKWTTPKAMEKEIVGDIPVRWKR